MVVLLAQSWEEWTTNVNVNRNQEWNTEQISLKELESEKDTIDMTKYHSVVLNGKEGQEVVVNTRLLYAGTW